METVMTQPLVTRQLELTPLQTLLRSLYLQYGCSKEFTEQRLKCIWALPPWLTDPILLGFDVSGFVLVPATFTRILHFKRAFSREFGRQG